MNKFLEKKYTTRLETAIENGDDIQTILDKKIEEYQSKNLPVEESIADYIALGVEGQKTKIEQYKNSLKEAKAILDELIQLEKETENHVYEWMKNKGIEKLNGIHCSSVTSKKEGVSITTKIKRIESDRELLERGLAIEEEVIKDIPASIKINKRRVA